MTRVGIVGGGITGLALAHYLTRAGIESNVFEASDQPGGVIRTTGSSNRVLEHGPQRVRLTEPVRELVSEINLDDRVVVADHDLPLFVYRGGRLREVPFTLSGFLRTDALSARAKLRIFCEPFTSSYRPGESVADLFRRKFGSEAYDHLIRPVFGGMYGSDPECMPARHALGPLLENQPPGGLLPLVGKHLVAADRPPAGSFTDGLQSLPDMLYSAHSERIALETPVTAMRSASAQYELVTDDTTSEFDLIVITTPAPEASTLLGDLAPIASRALQSLSYNSLVIVHLDAECDLTGLGYQVHPESSLSTLGVSWNASMFNRDGVYTSFLGGMKDAAIIERPSAELGEIAATEFESVVGCPATVLNVTRLPSVLPAYDHSWDALDRVELPDGIHLATNYTGRLGIPSRIREAKKLADRIAAGITD